MSLIDSEMQIEYDEEVQSYYIIWKPVICIAMGMTEREALEELRQAAHFGIDSTIDLKLTEID